MDDDDKVNYTTNIMISSMKNSVTHTYPVLKKPSGYILGKEYEKELEEQKDR